MSSTRRILSNELAAIVHHVELNRAGWWDKAVQRLILGSIWLLNKPLSSFEILSTIKDEFYLTLGEQKVNEAIKILEKQNALIRLPGPTPTFRIPDQQCTVFETEIADMETVTDNARSYFADLVKELCEGLEPDDTWDVFESKLLAPLIQEVGANAYQLIAGGKLAADEKLVRGFLEHFDSHHEISLNQLVTRFLDPKKDAVRRYVSCMLHAVFCVAASGLPENVIMKLSASSTRESRFRVFVDTNFLFSILELHDNPSNVAATELNDLIATLKTNSKIRVDLVMTSRTIDEAKQSISTAKTRLAGFPMGANFTQAALRADFSGMTRKYVAERSQRNRELSVSDWFDPYLSDLVPIARSKGVELFNETLDKYATRQDVVDDILEVVEFERSRNKPKTYEVVAHDMILWHLVNDRRPAYVESPSDAQDWILTLDYRFIHFDEFKRKQTGSTVPICVHPTSLIQLLQFWVPRTKEFEEAILGSMRLPFLFREFDAEAERTSLRILEGMGRFEGRDDLTEETIQKVMLNDSLRARIALQENENAEVGLIRDALLEEIRAQKEREANRAQQLQDTLVTHEETISTLEFKTKDKEKKIEELEGTVESKEQKLREANEAIQVQEQEIESIKVEKMGQELLVVRQRYFALLFGVITISCGMAWWLPNQLPSSTHILGITATTILVGIVMFLLCHLGLEWKMGRREPMNRLWSFRQMSRFRVWLWSFVIIVLFGGVLANLAANRIEEEIGKQELPIVRSPSENDLK